MKKILNLIITSFLAISVMGQPAEKSTTIKKRHGSENHHNLLNKDRKNNIQFSKGYKKPEACQLKSATAIKQKLDSVVTEAWDTTANEWYIDDKDIYTYDASGNNISYIYYYWDDLTSLWIPSYIEELAYNANNKIIQFIDSEWDEDSGKWFPSYKDEMTYDANGNMILSNSFDWDTDASEWVISYKDEYSYDGNGNMILDNGFYWDETENDWIPEYKEENFYDAAGNDTLYTDFYWDETTSEWVEDFKVEYTYNVNGNCILYISYGWDEIVSEWSPYYKTESTFDANGNMTPDLSYYWDDDAGEWVIEDKGEFEYNNAYSYDDMVLPYFSDEERDIFMHMPFQIISYEYYDTEWIPEYRTRIYFSDITISDLPGNILEAEVSVFPNPSSDYITFHLNEAAREFTLELFDTQGRKILSRLVQNEVPVSVQNLPRGIYFYKLNDVVNLHSGKLLLE